ncbi:AraC-like DNA-binding protein [Tamilnaduibacter salinus]|uniref:AraC-like DNA-binding protein n=1 Tax=Tamilnaduibacter salinus TaxID=1484056 RepID=A0A2A2I5Y5_9GAMM|nr:AraC family transcriptional regulator [Tamilnaduibacter salinus]PAV27421.1 hypothetical protein CF392_00455 [Tamilnaduibacter salinus]PVY75470.1 AraC-like DNA-binding protein [Tamilnaduibacter salinus]
MDREIALPAHFPRRLIAFLVDKQRIPFTDILAAVDLPPEAMMQVDALLDQDRYQKIVRYGIQRIGRDTLGLEFGENLHLSDLGLLGYAASAQPTIREAIQLFSDHYEGISRLSRIALEGGEDVFIRVFLEPDLPDDMARFLVQSIVAAIMHNLVRLGIPSSPAMRAHFHYERPNDLKGYRRLPGEVLFSDQYAGVYVPAQLLEQTLEVDGGRRWPEGLTLAGNDGAYRNTAEAPEESLAALIRSSFPEVPDVSTAARRLGFSARKLQRELADRSLTYTTLVEDVRMREASSRLMRMDLTIGVIAEQLGFADTASFSRAFRRYTGMSPRDYRKNGPAQEPARNDRFTDC